MQLLVFAEGWVLYRVGKYATVFQVHSCGGYCYETYEQQIYVDTVFFEKQEWYVRLMLEGEDRLAKNRESSWKGKTVSYPCGFRGLVFPGFPGIAAFGAVDRKRTDPGADGTSDERQRDIVTLYFCYGKTSGKLHKSFVFPQPTVSQTLMAALRRMRKGQKAGFLSKRAGPGGVLYEWENAQRSILLFPPVLRKYLNDIKGLINTCFPGPYSTVKGYLKIPSGFCIIYLRGSAL